MFYITRLRNLFKECPGIEFMNIHEKGYKLIYHAVAEYFLKIASYETAFKKKILKSCLLYDNSVLLPYKLFHTKLP